jgi:DNA-binding MurR/RpiR family transcriptional regulator
MNSDVINLIESKYFSLSKSQKRISDYILDNYSKVAFMTAKVLAKNSNVSESTVVRFANALGFEGYPELIEALQENIKSKLTTIERFDLINENSNLKDKRITNKIMQLDIQNIKSTINKNSKETIDKIVKELSNSQRIFILGLRSSKVLGSYLEYYLSLIFNETSVKEINPHSIFDSLVNLRSGDVLFAIGFPRYSKITIEALKYAKDNNTIISLTDSKLSPLSDYSKYTLLADLSISTFINSLAAPMSIINSLVMAISLENKKTVHEKFKRLETVWDMYDIFE